MDMIGGKWKALIIYNLKDGKLLFSQIMDRVQHKITQKTLTKDLREMENDGLIIRKVYPQVPPKVEYSLTDSVIGDPSNGGRYRIQVRGIIYF
ncbi:MAG: helix-turn-helix domain-containing protein [Methanosarcina sp.]